MRPSCWLPSGRSLYQRTIKPSASQDGMLHVTLVQPSGGPPNCQGGFETRHRFRHSQCAAQPRPPLLRPARPPIGGRAARSCVPAGAHPAAAKTPASKQYQPGAGQAASAACKRALGGGRGQAAVQGLPGPSHDPGTAHPRQPCRACLAPAMTQCCTPLAAPTCATVRSRCRLCRLSPRIFTFQLFTVASTCGAAAAVEPRSRAG